MTDRMTRARALYLAVYESQGGQWEANDCKELWCDKADRYLELCGSVAQAAPVAWRLTDGEGDYEYLTEEPSDQSRAWSRRYGREWEPLYASPVSSTYHPGEGVAHPSTHKSGAA